MKVRLEFEGRQNAQERWDRIPVAGTRQTPPGTAPDYGIGSPVGGIGAGKPKLPGDAPITILWASALPVKQAIAMTRFGQDGAKSDEARRVLDRSEPDYVLEIYGLPAMIAHRGTQMLQAEVKRTAHLLLKDRRVIRPGSVYAPIKAGKLVITMRFPRVEPIRVQDKWVECFADAGAFRIRKRFDLKPMLYRGRLEL